MSGDDDSKGGPAPAIAGRAALGAEPGRSPRQAMLHAMHRTNIHAMRRTNTGRACAEPRPSQGDEGMCVCGVAVVFHHAGDLACALIESHTVAVVALVAAGEHRRGIAAARTEDPQALALERKALVDSILQSARVLARAHGACQRKHDDLGKGNDRLAQAYFSGRLSGLETAYATLRHVGETVGAGLGPLRRPLDTCDLLRPPEAHGDDAT